MQILTLDLQLFAEVGAAAPAAQAVNGAPATPNGENGAETSAASDAENLDEEYRELVNTKFKAQHSRTVSAIVKDRLKNSKQQLAALQAEHAASNERLTELLDLAGVDDVDGLKKVLETAKSRHIEEESIRRGVPTDDVKREEEKDAALRKSQREKAALQAQIETFEREKHENRIKASWRAQAEEVKKKYPEFDLETELENPEFFDLITNGKPIEKAYTYVHLDEISSDLMKYGAKKGAEVTAGRFAANAQRPVEGAISKSGSGVPLTDVKSMTREERQALIKRAAHGEIIRF